MRPTGPVRKPPRERTKKPVTATAPEVVVEDVYKSFDHPVLQGVNFTATRGELVAIVGQSGGGKTVLLKLITGHFPPDKGRILLADHELPDAPLRDLASRTEEKMDRIRRHWAIVFQRNALLTGSVYNNLALWPREILQKSDEELRPKARKALADVGLEPGEVIDKDRETLSGGMAKRVAIARALMMDPVLIMYDEPTAGLDPEMSAHIHGLIEATHQRRPALGIPRTSIVVTHDTELLRRLRPRIVMLMDGRVGFDGTFEQFTQSDDPRIRPYLDQMPLLHARVPEHDGAGF
jgi:phospholipid/cholesterol/gamma-HCH transport system ATP-binding protein